MLCRVAHLRHCFAGDTCSRSCDSTACRCVCEACNLERLADGSHFVSVRSVPILLQGQGFLGLQSGKVPANMQRNQLR